MESKCIDFGSDSDFEFNGSSTTTFRIELLGYNPSQDRSDDNENIWELDEFSVYGCCGDSNQNVTFTETCNQRITIRDTERPTLSNVPSNITIDCMDDIPAVPTNVVANDNCAFETFFTEEIISGSAPCDYVIRRTWRVEDACQNFRQGTQTITIRNNIAASIEAPNTVCEGNSPTLRATGTGGCGGYTYSWSTGATSRTCLLYTSPSPRDATLSRMPSSA